MYVYRLCTRNLARYLCLTNSEIEYNSVLNDNNIEILYLTLINC